MRESDLPKLGKNLLSTLSVSSLPLHHPCSSLSWSVAFFSPFFPLAHGEVKCRDVPWATQGGCSPAQFGAGRGEQQPDGASY